ncbi:similar to Saccharomyces cerevisiae YGR083C GCD2 Delta subunit of the translation initiation factor eIF2B, the guanine-nucleotide exchange factor for eIF2 [Maudiozyma saulgeensis]|uniref:Translation initiation factor eIF2B subunit delta n=1 Tax=Maudiozyma saulgeensis TaxID=1789683 RepID=A0A1X7QX43_9SACH|nr:similar to Saccharomyces cerevisiae YGR083C GCD2 Delta subunit of the translation initiation factor eIF2B, the guanine-nucleotide exchange factor for eIF2 [Kazachstania saulgeensis]
MSEPVVEIKPSGENAPQVPADSNEKKLTNKELKELKKQEKAAKRSAKKQASGISVEQQQAQAQAKRDKKQHQREKQQQELQKKEQQQQKLLNNKNVKKTSLFSHLETTEERRATLLAIGSALNSPRAARITAAGLMVPVVASALSGAKVYTTSNLGNNIQAISESSNQANEGADTTLGNNVDLAKSLASISLENNEVSVVPGVSSIIPHALKKSLDTPELISNIKELLINKDFIHPVISSLTFNLAIYKIVGSIPRCIAMLEAFQIVIQDYKTPKGTTLSRNLTNYLSHQIDLLKRARPLSVTMGNAIRWLKQEISHIDPSTPDNEAKLDLCEKIGLFAKEKIELADQLIIENASNQIEDRSTIVTFGSSKVLTELILHNAKVLKKDLEIIVVDSRPLFEGKKMAAILRENGVKVIYTLITSLDTVFNMGVDYVFLGAHSILSNGFLYSRAGTAMIAMSAKRRNIPVLVCCESLKFSQRVQLDSVTYNELADPNDLVPIDYESPMERRSNKGILLKQFVKERHENTVRIAKENAPKGNKQQQQQQQKNKNAKDRHNKSDEANGKEVDAEQSENVLDDWQKLSSLNIVNILYDLTPPEYIKKVITEFGALPPSSVPVILREYKGSA